jgi:hypothetical protein
VPLVAIEIGDAEQLVPGLGRRLEARVIDPKGDHIRSLPERVLDEGSHRPRRHDDMRTSAHGPADGPAAKAVGGAAMREHDGIPQIADHPPFHLTGQHPRPGQDARGTLSASDPRQRKSFPGEAPSQLETLCSAEFDEAQAWALLDPTSDQGALAGDDDDLADGLLGQTVCELHCGVGRPSCTGGECVDDHRACLSRWGAQRSRRFTGASCDQDAQPGSRMIAPNRTGTN